MRHDIETPIRVLVAADSAVARAGIEALVEASPALDLAGAAQSLADWASLTKLARSVAPDVVLVHLHGLHGDSLAATMADLVPESAGRDSTTAPALVILAGDLDGDWASEALLAGARAVLPAAATGAAIVAAIVAAASGLVVVHPEVAESLLSHGLSGPSPDAEKTRAAVGAAGRAEFEGRGRALTPREIEVLNLLAQGLGNKEIAWRLHISEHTVKFHISSVFTKLDVSGRTEAVTTGLRLGLIML